MRDVGEAVPVDQVLRQAGSDEIAIPKLYVSAGADRRPAHRQFRDNLHSHQPEAGCEIALSLCLRARHRR